MILTRRSFFRNLKDNILEGLHESLPIMLTNPEIKQDVRNEWVEAGNISEFPPGKDTFVNNKEFVVISNEQGIYTVSATDYEKGQLKSRFILKLEAGGLLLINRNKLCPEGTLFSPILNDLVNEEEEEI